MNEASNETYQKFKKNAKKVGEFLSIALIAILKLLLKLIPKALLIVLICAIGGGYLIGVWRATIETRGAEQRYTYNDYNDLEIDESDKRLKATNLGYLNKQYKAFYKYVADNSYYQIIGKRSKKLERQDHVKDYYNKENMFKMSPGLMFSLDEYMHKKSFRYPEQFIKPVYADLDKMELLDLTDDDGLVIAKSKRLEGEKDRVKRAEGMRTKNEIKSVRDYGLASIFKYFEDFVITKERGTILNREVYDPETNSIKTVAVNEEYEEILGEELAYFMSNAVTFVGDFEFIYERQEEFLRMLDEDERKVQYGTCEICDRKEDENTGEIIEYNCVEVPLYETRDGGIYQELPVVVEENKNYKGLRYVEDYLMNYESDVPESVTEEFNFEERVGKLVDYDLNVGTNDMAFEVFHYDEWFKKYGEEYDVDPKLLAAIAMVESSGNPLARNYNGSCWGLMQISEIHAGTDPDMNITKNPETDDRLKPEKAIKWAAKHFRYLLDEYNGDVVKALYGYNYGINGFNKVYKDMYAKYGDNWLYHMDNDYAPKVLSYYDGDIDFSSMVFYEENDKGFFQRIKEFFTGVFDIDNPKEKRVLYTRYVKQTEVDVILRMADTFDTQQSFSDTNLTEISFWDRGFNSFYEGLMENSVTLDMIKQILEKGDEFFPPILSSGARISGLFGESRGGGTRRHGGIDIAICEGTPVFAMADGRVKLAQTGYNGGYGTLVILQHANGLESYYAHLSQVLVSPGDVVKKGQVIAKSGNTGRSTGPHLHFECRLNGVRVNPEHFYEGGILPTP